MEVAGPAETLAGDGPFTVFSPAADAFAGPPADIPALTEVLLYHLVSGSVLAAGVVGLDAATTLQGQSVPIP